jgi:hypothetical protein
MASFLVRTAGLGTGTGDRAPSDTTHLRWMCAQSPSRERSRWRMTLRATVHGTLIACAST